MKVLARAACPPSYLDRYIAIRDRKHLNIRDKLTQAHAFVKERFDELTTTMGSQDISGIHVDPRSRKIADELRACYNIATSPLRDLKDAIKSVQPSRTLKYCPMCGTTLHSTFDHYMPMVRFPEFSVHPLNLVPCCSKCNSIKLDDWLASNGERQYLHSFVDDVSQYSFLKATLIEDPHLTGVGATFSLSRPRGLNVDQYRLIASHFKRLHLLERYKDLSNDEIADCIASCRVYLNSGGPDVKSFLMGQAEDLLGLYGASNWRAILMIELAGHENLNSWIEAMP
jgi:endogenous inhibitor of DNA gyrase (YacG/DUF329 family)